MLYVIQTSESETTSTSSPTQSMKSYAIPKLRREGKWIMTERQFYYSQNRIWLKYLAIKSILNKMVLCYINFILSDALHCNVLLVLKNERDSRVYNRFHHHYKCNSTKKLHLEKGLLLLLDPNIVVPALPSWGLSLSQLAGGSFRSVFSCRRA